jgi:23S rRNA (uracil1939-C5)-methyltransferase
VGVEGLQTMVDKATYNAQMSKLNNTEFFQADLNSNWGKQVWAHRKYSKVLLDPARAGAYEALVQLIYLGISNIVYVSCDPATLAKDSQLLISNGYTIEKIAIMDMFAQTKHIETMILFKK